MTEQEIYAIKHTSEELTLSGLLGGYKKAQLLEMGESLAGTLPKSWKKDKLIQALSERIIEQAQTIYAEILEQVIDTLPDRSQTMYYLSSLDSIRSLAPLIKKGFFFAVQSEKEIIFIIPTEVLDAVESAGDDNTSLLEKTAAEEAQSPHNDVTTHQAAHSLRKWKNQMISIYGSYTSTHLQQIWNRYYSENLSIAEIEDLLAED